jgi:hypothetical protein
MTPIPSAVPELFQEDNQAIKNGEVNRVLLRLTAVKAPDSHHPRINTSLTSIEIDGT